MQLRRRYRKFNMLKRVHSHIKVRKPAFLDVGLSASQRSKSLTQINCVGGPEVVLHRKGKMNSRPEPEAIIRHTLALPPGGMTGHGSDRLTVPPCYGEEGDKKTRLLKLHHKMSSPDYFSVTVDLQDDAEYEMLPAVRGVPVREVLQGLLDRRGVDVHQVAIYVDASSTPLPLTFDTARLGGNHLYVKLKDVTEATPDNLTGSSNHRPPASRTSSVGSREDKSRKITASFILRKYPST
ncbi:pleckstrin homology domain-containing family G member 5-like [Tachypleus tridentatus]|uniref:pleckstrin homology domain-containing family G member 5-like n=1 Tax=Tachypleus tridentatus TaxID=6853 RepID=UPI003FD0C3B6